MRLVAIDRGGERFVSLLDGERVVPLAPVDEFYADLATWSAGSAAVEHEGLPLAEVKLVPAVPVGARVLCIGLNYRDHAAESGMEVPDHPTVFARWTRSLIVAGDTIPALDPRLDFEGELAVVIGRELASVDEAEGLAGVFAYAPFNDVSARTYQRHTSQFTPGKNMDRSGPIGALVTADEVGDPGRGLRIVTRLNGETVQDGTTADMIFPVGRIIAYLSQVMTLYPGDVIATGTPAGVGAARKPPLFMQPGDRIEVEIERVGSVANRVVDASER